MPLSRAPSVFGLFVFALSGPFVASVSAQVSSPVTIRVHVVDSASVPVENADVSIVKGLKEVVTAGTTDRNGVYVLHVDVREDSYQLVVRKIGFARGSRFLLADSSDNMRAEIVLSRAVQRLDPVKVTAEVNRTRERTFIDADAIAASDRPLFDAIDIIEKLRPDMTTEPTGCTRIKALWVNGVRVAYKGPGPALGNRRDIPATARPGHVMMAAPPDAIVALAEIKPEHIASIEYRNCFDKTVAKVGGESALFVVLKDGVAFRRGEGSFVVSPAQQDSILKSVTRTP
jgi:hypothetical protein